MRRLVIFIGPPAGGKTSTAYALAEKLGDSLVIEVDKIKEKISGGISAKDDEERELWFEEINKQIKEGLNKYQYVIVDEGFFTQELLDKILIGVEEIPKTVVEINYGREEYLKRDQARPDHNLEAFNKMMDVWEGVPENERIISDILINNKLLNIEGLVFMIQK